MGAFSTQTSIENRISADRLGTIAGFGAATVNAGALASAIAFAWSHIAGRLRKTFGSTEIDTWVLPDDVPVIIANISDSLCIFQLSVIRPELWGIDEGPNSILAAMDALLDDINENPSIVYGATYTFPDVEVDSLDSVYDDDDNTSNAYPTTRTWL